MKSIIAIALCVVLALAQKPTPHNKNFTPNFAAQPEQFNFCDSDPASDDLTLYKNGLYQLHDSAAFCFPDMTSCEQCVLAIQSDLTSYTISAPGTPYDGITTTYVNALANGYPILYQLPGQCVANSIASYAYLGTKTQGSSFGLNPYDFPGTTADFSSVTDPTTGKPIGKVTQGNFCNSGTQPVFMCGNPLANQPGFTNTAPSVTVDGVANGLNAESYPANFNPATSSYTYSSGASFWSCRSGGALTIPLNGNDPNTATNTFTSEGQLVGDPHFVGFDRSKFDFFGTENEWYNIITDVNFQFNAFFVTYGKHASYMSTVGVTAGKTHISYNIEDVLSVEGQKVSEFQNADVKITRETIKDSDFVIIKTSTYQLKIKIVTNQEGKYLNIYSSVVGMPSRPHGVLGQTADYIVKGVPAKARKGQDKQGLGVVEGNYLDYNVKDGQFGIDFRFNKYVGGSVSSFEAQGFNKRRSTGAFEEVHAEFA